MNRFQSSLGRMQMSSSKGPSFASYALFSAFLALVSSASAFEWKVCEGTHSKLQSITDVTLKPEPVPAGSTANFEIQGSSKVGVESGKMQLAVFYLGLHVYSKTLDLPQPISKGDFTTSFEERFPIYTPPGSYKVQIQTETEDGEELACLEVAFKVLLGRSRSSLLF